jgi:hypothetical protein
MLKTISAALLAASMIAAPAFAANIGKATQAPAAKTVQAPAIKGTGVKTDAKASAKTTSKTGALNANAKMGHHNKHYRHHHHKKMSALKPHKASFKNAGQVHAIKAHAAKVSKIQANKSHSKVSFKRVAPAAKRG